MNPFAISSFLVAFTSLGFGLFVLLKGPKRKLNRLWFLFALFVTGWGVGGFVIALEQNPAVALVLWKWAIAIPVVWIPVLFYRFICELCRLSRPKVLLAYYLIAALNTALYLATDLMFKDIRYVFGEFYWNVIGPLHPIFMAWWSFVVFHAHYELWQAFRQSRGITQGQIKSAFLAGFIGYTAGMLEFLPDYRIDLYPWSNFVVAFYPAIMSYGIFKYHLFDIRIVIRRSLIYSILVTILAIGYFGTIYLIEQIFQAKLGYRSTVVSVTAFALMALAFQPLKIGIQIVIDRLFFRTRREDLVRRVERLEQETRGVEKLKAVATLAAGLCHELRNPLQAIQTHAEFLPQRYNDLAFIKRCSEVMKIEIERVNDLLRQLMDFARPKSPVFRPVDPHGILDSTLDLLNNEFAKRQIGLEKRYQANSVQIQADADQLRQVVLNLVLNALQAINKNGQVTVTTRQDDGWFTLEVSDTGPGIDPDILPKIFEPFVSTKEGGTGLGLSIVHSIVQEHRGEISIQSQPAHGATFTIKLPLA